MQAASERIDGAAPILEQPQLEEQEVKEQVEHVRSLLDQIDTEVRRLVQQQPLVAVGVALVFGYALGRLLVRR